MELSVELHNKIVEFLTSLPNIHDSNVQRAFINSAFLDSRLQGQISYSGSPAQFFQLLVSTLLDYGMLEDGRDALEAVLESAQNSVGQDRRKYCDALIQKLPKFKRAKRGSRQKTSDQSQTQKSSQDTSQTITATNHSFVSNVAQFKSGNIVGSTVINASGDVVQGVKVDINLPQPNFDNIPGNRATTSETRRNLDLHILRILYTYYEQHSGDPQIHFNELVRFTGAEKRHVPQCLYGLRQKKWVEYELTENAESGLVWLTPLGVKVAQGNNR